MSKKFDTIEREYLLEIKRAEIKGDSDRAFEFSIGLKQYRELYKDGPTEYDDSTIVHE